MKSSLSSKNEPGRGGGSKNHCFRVKSQSLLTSPPTKEGRGKIPTQTDDDVGANHALERTGALLFVLFLLAACPSLPAATCTFIPATEWTVVSATRNKVGWPGFDGNTPPRIYKEQTAYYYGSSFSYYDWSPNAGFPFSGYQVASMNVSDTYEYLPDNSEPNLQTWFGWQDYQSYYHYSSNEGYESRFSYRTTPSSWSDP